MAISSKPILISIVGPTAVGKTALSIQIAEHLDTHIISADSRQFYREMSIGTAKPTAEELSRVPHHFVDSHSISELYSAGQFGRDAIMKIEELHNEHLAVVAVGGSGLYLKAIWEGFDDMPEVEPEIREKLNKELDVMGLAPLLEELESFDPAYFEQVDKKNKQRVIRALEVIRGTGRKFSSFRRSDPNEMPYRHLKIGLNTERELLFDRINSRMDQMIEMGLFEEAAMLYAFKDHNALQTVGYSEIFDFMDGKYDKGEAIRLLKRNSRRYAKRQLTWFRKYADIHWFEPSDVSEIMQQIRSTLSL